MSIPHLDARTRDLGRFDPVALRTMQAIWYAYGRKDERRGHPNGVTMPDADVDPFAFGEWAAQQYLDMESGAVGFCPSVQDQWRVYLWQKAHPEGR